MSLPLTMDCSLNETPCSFPFYFYFSGILYHFHIDQNGVCYLQEETYFTSTILHTTLLCTTILHIFAFCVHLFEVFAANTMDCILQSLSPLSFNWLVQFISILYYTVLGQVYVAVSLVLSICLVPFYSFYFCRLLVSFGLITMGCMSVLCLSNHALFSTPGLDLSTSCFLVL